MAAMLLLFLASPIIAETIEVDCSQTGRKADAFASLLFDAELPGKNNIFFHTKKSLHEFASCEIKLVWPADAPADAQILAFVKDWDFYWYQNLLPGNLVPGSTNSFVINYKPSAENWEPRGHYGAWCLRSTIDPSDMGFSILSKTHYRGKVQLISATFTPKPTPEGLPTISNVRANEATLPCFDKFEITLNLPDRYPDPFDSSEVLLYAEFVQPDGSEQRIDGFYMQEYMRLEDLAETRVSPQGKPYWCIRYTPQKEGKHSFRIIAEDRTGKTQWGPGTFQATKASKPGFVRPSRKDTRFFEFDNNDFFFPIGHNIRSPFDTRMDRNFPWKQRWPEGSSAYARYFQNMHKSGQNMVEVWFAAWSLGLEWNKKRFGYHGIGQYNLIHAFEMDQVIDLADENDIYVNLVIHNHGKYSTFSDEEWEDNPFNTRNGGWMSTPGQFFTDERAVKSYLKLMRYKVARWGYSTRVFAWQLWSELNLTGSENERNLHKSQETVDWHKFASRSIKEMDPYDHMISTHVSGDYGVQNPDLISLKGIDLCPVDAYHGSRDPLHIVELITSTANFNNPYKKPVLVTEFGGSWNAGSKDFLEASLHSGLWASTCTPVAGTPLFWWWGLLEEENYYPYYRAIQNFMEDMDQRDPTRKSSSPAVFLNASPALEFQAIVFKNKTICNGWVYYTGNWIGTLSENATTDALYVELKNMANGLFQVEFWDTMKGEIVSSATAKSDKTKLIIKAPRFTRDIAFKVKPREKSSTGLKK